MAERRDEGAVTGGRMDEELPLGRGHGLAVEVELDHGVIVPRVSDAL